MEDWAMNRPMEGHQRLSLLIPAFVRCYDGTGRAARRRCHRRADPCFRLSPMMMTGADDVLMLVEQLDMASSALYEES
jgi:hypothetical protein